MKQELINRSEMFKGKPLNYQFAVSYQSYYKENTVDFNYPNGINPNPQMVECENADFFENKEESLARMDELKKISYYHNIEFHSRN
jgi:hypothetical protein